MGQSDGALQEVHGCVPGEEFQMGQSDGALQEVHGYISELSYVTEASHQHPLHHTNNNTQFHL